MQLTGEDMHKQLRWEIFHISGTKSMLRCHLSSIEVRQSGVTDKLATLLIAYLGKPRFLNAVRG